MAPTRGGGAFEQQATRAGLHAHRVAGRRIELDERYVLLDLRDRTLQRLAEQLLEVGAIEARERPFGDAGKGVGSPRHRRT